MKTHLDGGLNGSAWLRRARKAVLIPQALFP